MSASITMAPFGEASGAPFDCGMVRRAMQQLPAEEREVLMLHWLRGLKYGEIAVELSLPVAGVQARIAGARAALRTLVAVPQSAAAH